MIAERKQILVVDDELNLRRVLEAQLTRDGYDVHTAEDGLQGLAALCEHHIDLVITDLRMPNLDGMGLLRKALEIDPELPIVLLTAHGTVDNAVEALKTGAFDYITKPFDQDDVRRVVQKAIRTRELTLTEATQLAASASDAELRYAIIGQSAAILEINAALDRVADAPAPVLLSGENGTGKELLARAIHRASSRRERPFIKINCAAMPRDALDGELWGYERGALPSAVTGKPGRFELAQGGSLFLDDIDALSLETQHRLLNVLQENVFERLGAVHAIACDVRLIAATHRDLKALVQAGSFREDLFYRLNVVSIELPPLRERAEDTVLIARYLVQKFALKLKKAVSGMSENAEHVLRAYDWPGNVRELENVIERAVLFCDGALIEVTDLPQELSVTRKSQLNPAPVGAGIGLAGVSAAVAAPGAFATPPADGLKELVKARTAEIERELIQRALVQTGNNVTHAARLLKISRKGLQLKMKELGLREERGEG